MFVLETREGLYAFRCDVWQRYESACAHGIDSETFCCDHCPHSELCDREELYWGCGVWKESMGMTFKGSSLF